MKWEAQVYCEFYTVVKVYRWVLSAKGSISQNIFETSWLDSSFNVLKNSPKQNGKNLFLHSRPRAPPLAKRFMAGIRDCVINIVVILLSAGTPMIKSTFGILIKLLNVERPTVSYYGVGFFRRNIFCLWDFISFPFYRLYFKRRQNKTRTHTPKKINIKKFHFHKRGICKYNKNIGIMVCVLQKKGLKLKACVWNWYICEIYTFSQTILRDIKQYFPKYM